MSGRRPLLSKFMAKVSPEPNTGCWLWVGAMSADGYGFIGNGSKNERAHRVSHKLFNGPVPDSLCVLHSCDCPTCVNPSHLFIGTLKDNAHDMIAKGRAYRFGVKV